MFTFCLKLPSSGTWQITATRLKPAYVMKKHILKWMSYNKINQSYDLSYDENLFLSHQKVTKVKWLNLSKEEWSPLIRRLPIKVTFNSLLLAVRIDKSSKSCKYLQNKRCFLIAELSSALTLFWGPIFSIIR